MKRQATDGGEITAIHINDIGLIPTVYKRTLKTVRRQTIQFLKRQRPEQAPHQTRYTDDRQAHEKMIKI